MAEKIWREVSERGPLVATAIHDGHEVRDELLAHIELPELNRLREEDPHTGEWTSVAPNRVLGLRSRFEVDLNRPRDKAVYRKPEDAWGLKVWKDDVPPALFDKSLENYDEFYAGMHEFFSKVEQQGGRFVVYDLHTYNHRRNGPDGLLADAEGNPQVNIGTGTMDRTRWAPVVDRFIADLGAYDFPGGQLDVRENVKFFGGNFGRWIHQTFPETGCALSIEFKKFFMDEWTGEPDRALVDAITEALRSTVPGVLEVLDNL